MVAMTRDEKIKRIREHGARLAMLAIDFNHAATVAVVASDSLLDELLKIGDAIHSANIKAASHFENVRSGRNN